MDLIEKLAQHEFHGIGKCSDTDISRAEEILGIEFSSEYRIFLKNYKAGSINGHEIMGVAVPKYIDTVYNTLFSRENDDSFPEGCFVLENMGIEGALTLSDADGHIFTYCEGGKNLLCNSLGDFIDYLACKRK